MSEIRLKIKAGRDRAKNGFVAEAVSKDGITVKADHALRHSVGRPTAWLEKYAQLEGWKIEYPST